MKHKHHIIPVHMGGTDDTSNIEEISVEEHAEKHRILFEQHGHWQDYLAWQGLAGRMGKEEIIRYKISQTHKGKKLTPEHIEILREKGKKLTGNNNPFFGKTHSEEGRKGISKGNKGKIITEETRQKMAIASTGRLHTEISKEKNRIKAIQRHKDGKYNNVDYSAKMLGKKQTENQKQSVAKALAKNYLITEPSGKQYEITNLNKFCREQGLDQGNLSRGSNKGWKCVRIVTEPETL